MVTTLFDFASRRTVDDWMSINDVVMGGVSSGRLEATEGNTAAFTGVVSLENDGGFASVRSRAARLDLRGHEGLEILVRGDGRRYKINMTVARAEDVLYRALFEPREGEWQTLRLPFTEFLATFRGRILPDAPPLELSRVTSLGLMISDRQAGPFYLEISRISAFTN